MRRLAAALCFATVSANSALASPAMTTVPTQMRQAPSSHAPIVQSIPPNAEIDVGGCGKIWCSASWRDIPGYVRASSIAAAPGAPPLVYADAPPAAAGRRNGAAARRRAVRLLLGTRLGLGPSLASLLRLLRPRLRA